MQYKIQNLINRAVTNHRQSNIELLRIITMIMIVAHHFSLHGRFDFSTASITLPRLWVQFIQIGGKIGVDVFVLISGYFLIHAESIKFTKILKLWLQLFFYSLVIYLVFVITGSIPFSIKEIIKYCLPISFVNWWFASTYFILYILSPFINKFLKGLDKSTYQKMLILLLVIWCIFPTATGKDLESNNLLWFIFLYATAAYIHLWHDKVLFSCKTYHLFALLLTAITFGSTVFFDILGTKFTFFGNHATLFYRMNSLPIYMISIFMLIGFKELQIGYSRIINRIAAATFGVYLIHDNVFMRRFLWIKLFKNTNYSNTVFIIPFSIGIIVLVYLACTCIELIRIYLIEKQYMKLVSKTEPLYQNFINNLFAMKIFSKL